MRRGLLGRTGRAARIGAIVGVAVSMVALGTGTAGAAALPAPPGSTGPALVKDPAGLVNTFIGTGSGGAVVGDVDLFPGAAVPFGMLTFSPQTPSEPDGGGYYYGDSSIDGFALTHISGPGCSAYGDFPILPTVGAIGTDPNATTDPFSHSHESATPGAYSVTLSPGTAEAISTRLSATTRTGIASFQFPATSKANLIFKVGQNQMETSAADVHVIGNDEVTGSVTSGHFCGDPGTFSVHFVATFNRPFRSYGTFDGTKVSASSTAPQGPPSPPSPGAPGAPGAPAVVASASGTSSGAYVSFDTASPGQRSVKMKVAISYVSTANAMLNLRAGDPGE
jgi:putative alpha-1,2-mannosidase